jgi:O-succinylbenzoic acid--CoA ligase
MELGVAFVPVHPRLTADETARLLAQCAPARVLLEPDLAALADGPPRAEHTDGGPRGDDDPRRALAVLYTSGTSGTARGARLSRGAFLASARASAEVLGDAPDDAWLLCLPLCHVGGLSILTRALRARRAVVMLGRFEPAAVLAALARHRPALLSVVPTMLHALLREDRAGALAAPRAVIVGGAACSAELLRECAARGIAARTTYGLTEACSQVTLQRARPRGTVEPGSGVALPGTSVRIADAAGGSRAAGQSGRILVRGPTLMDGYEGAAAAGAGPWFDTGDLGALDAQGRLFVHARRTDLIVTGGENVYPVEVEHALEALPGVARALVFGVADERWGQLVAALIEPAREAQPRLREEALVTALATRLAPHKRPRRVHFVDAVPLLANGKPDRAGAAARYATLVRPFERS